GGPDQNVVVRIEGFDPDRYGPHQRVPHWEVGDEHGILDLERGAKIAGSMFVMYRKGGATLTRALCQLALDRNADAFEEIRPPTPEQAPAMHAGILARAESTLVELGLPYRVLDICTGDLGQSHARQYDLEVYAPGCDMWLEVSSVSWFTDYQARRANVRFKPVGGGGTAFVHTLNGSALAVPRVWAAIVETYRRADG